MNIISTYALSLKDIVYCICNIIDDPVILCNTAQVNKLFCNIITTLSYYKSCKLIYMENGKNSYVWNDKVIKYGNLRLLKFLMVGINKIHLDSIFINSCYYGQLEISKWLIKYFNSIKPLINIHADNELAFQWACNKGQLETVKWLIEYGISINSPINIHACSNLAFDWACEKGHLVLVQWLINYAILINSPMNIHINNDRAFRLACINNQLKTAKWLADYANLSGTIIDIHRDNDYIFKYICKYGYLEIAKWLIEYSKMIGSPIDLALVADDSIFKNSSMDIIVWLLTL